jgi:hypothetical protein
MRKVLLLIIVPALCLRANAQGTIRFMNIRPGGAIDAPVYQSDGVTKLSGAQYLAELLAGPGPSSLGPVATTEFLTGNAVGYFDGGTVAVNSVPPGNTAWVQVYVWNMSSGASFAQAQNSGLPNSWWQSSVFDVQTGGQLTGTGTAPPGPLLGLGTSPVYLNGVPEPATLALTGLGAVSVLLRFLRRTGSKN